MRRDPSRLEGFEAMHAMVELSLTAGNWTWLGWLDPGIYAARSYLPLHQLGGFSCLRGTRRRSQWSEMCSYLCVVISTFNFRKHRSEACFVIATLLPAKDRLLIFFTARPWACGYTVSCDISVKEHP